MADLIHTRKTKVKHTPLTRLFAEIAHPFLQRTEEYFAMRRTLNKEQQVILKDILMTKRLALHKPLHLFLTGGTGTGKTYIAKVIYEALIRLYDKQLDSDPLKPKGIIVASTGKPAFNVGGYTAHSIFHLQYNSYKLAPLDADTLDNLSKNFDQL